MFTILLFIFVLIQNAQLRPTFDAKQHLHTYGFLNTSNPGEKVFKDAIEKFQSVNELPTTGTLDEATIERMKARRCGRPEHVPAFAQTANKWKNSHITYKIFNVSEPFMKTEVKKIFDDSIKVWTDNVNLKISETDSNKADIIIHFTTQDGPYNVLGYAYYPDNGDIFFDKDEDWTLDVSQGAFKTYFGWVAAHELGHSLGLPHTETMQSIMHPYYSTQVIQPSEIDTKTLRTMYGQAIMNNSILCEGTSVDAILDTREPLLVVGEEYWTISDGVLQSGPIRRDVLFPGLPDKIDAAFMVGKRSYFLSDNLFYRFDHDAKPYRLISKKLISVGFDKVPPNIDAAFYHAGATTIYFFKGSKYYALNTRKPSGKRLVVNGKDISSDWPGIPTDVEAVTLTDNSQVLFIKNSKCYMVDLNTRVLLSTENCSTLYNC
ncbi:hypothetical protein Zmor_014072 [Zophobas morio]|uniref:Peptidase metallopeptidase domain-containing protein n=1 Tax=Zophobas morio TaxID=2755281 RepID=A0AA38MFC8_9CUCU|nr:hypothetical protein Zmor_014072 [Zophobas morio]